MTNANKFNLLLDVVKLMHSLADGLEAVAYGLVQRTWKRKRNAPCSTFPMRALSWLFLPC